jgi:hypothetical protein
LPVRHVQPGTAAARASLTHTAEISVPADTTPIFTSAALLAADGVFDGDRRATGPGAQACRAEAGLFRHGPSPHPALSQRERETGSRTCGQLWHGGECPRGIATTQENALSGSPPGHIVPQTGVASAMPSAGPRVRRAARRGGLGGRHRALGPGITRRGWNVRGIRVWQFSTRPCLVSSHRLVKLQAARDGRSGQPRLGRLGDAAWAGKTRPRLVRSNAPPVGQASARRGLGGDGAPP